MTQPNALLIQVLVDRPGPLADEFVFIGGTVMGLLITENAVPPARPTKDVDVVDEATTILAYEEMKAKRLDAWFREDPDPDAPHLCRWIDDGLLLAPGASPKNAQGYCQDDIFNKVLSFVTRRLSGARVDERFTLRPYER